MTIKRDEAIQDIIRDIESLSNKVLEQLDHVETIITSGEITVPEGILKTILSNEKSIDKKEVKLSEKIVNTIVLYQPIASDLRKIMAAYRIVISLERISDLVVNIADFMTKLKVPSVYEKLKEVIHTMIYQSNRMVKESLLSYLNNDRELAIWTLKNETVFEDLNNKLLKKLLSKKATAENNKHLLMSIISIKEMMSDIERIADHATNIAEAAIYYLDGKDIRHSKIPE